MRLKKDMMIGADLSAFLAGVVVLATKVMVLDRWNLHCA